MNIKPHLLHQIAANYIIGKDLKIDIKGTQLQTECFNELLKVSRNLKIYLDEKRSLKEINVLLENKKQLTSKFQDITGITWYL